MNFDWIFSPLWVKGLINTDDVFFQGLTSIIEQKKGAGLYFENRPFSRFFGQAFSGSENICLISVSRPSELTKPDTDLTAQALATLFFS